MTPALSELDGVQDKQLPGSQRPLWDLSLRFRDLCHQGMSAQPALHRRHRNAAQPQSNWDRNKKMTSKQRVSHPFSPTSTTPFNVYLIASVSVFLARLVPTFHLHPPNPLQSPRKRTDFITLI